jgi:hypothetical protein
MSVPRRLAAVLALGATLFSAPAFAQLSREQIMATPAQQIQVSAMFQFGRTRYFDALVTQRKCKKIYLDRTQAAQSRFRLTTARLAKRIDAAFFDADKPVDLARGSPGGCDEATLWSFEDKVRELEAWADRADAEDGRTD